MNGIFAVIHLRLVQEAPCNRFKPTDQLEGIKYAFNVANAWTQKILAVEVLKVIFPYVKSSMDRSGFFFIDFHIVDRRDAQTFFFFFGQF